MIYALFGNLWAKKRLFRSKTVFLGQEVYYYTVYISYYTDLDFHICKYAQKQRICRENSKYALDENFMAIFALAERKAANFCHPVLLLLLLWRSAATNEQVFQPWLQPALEKIHRLNAAPSQVTIPCNKSPKPTWRWISISINNHPCQPAEDWGSPAALTSRLEAGPAAPTVSCLEVSGKKNNLQQF